MRLEKTAASWEFPRITQPPILKGFPSGAVVKNLPANARDTGDVGLVPGLERPPGVGNGRLHQYSCLENPIDRGAWQAGGHKELDTAE